VTIADQAKTATKVATSSGYRSAATGLNCPARRPSTYTCTTDAR